jgi:hypothetical protein
MIKANDEAIEISTTGGHREYNDNCAFIPESISGGTRDQGEKASKG